MFLMLFFLNSVFLKFAFYNVLPLHFIFKTELMKLFTRVCLIAAYALPLFLTFNAVAQQKTEKEYFVSCIAFYNLENLFDTIDNENVNDAEFTPAGANKWNSEKYLEKLANMSKVIVDIGTEVTPDGPAILGIAEIENIGVVQDLINTPLLKDKNYGIVHFDSPDRRGVDVGLIYQHKYFKVTNSKSYPLTIEGRDDFYTRDQLVVSGMFQGEPMHFIVAHWPSRRGGEKRSRPLRNEAAKVARHIVDSLLTIDPMAKIVVMGDFNDDPNNESVKKHLNSGGDAGKLSDGQLFNTMYELFNKGIGSLGYRDSWNLFDQIIISQGFLKAPAQTYVFHKAKIYNKPYLVSQEGQFKGYPFRTYSFGTYIGGYSDHFPTYIFVKKEKN